MTREGNTERFEHRADNALLAKKIAVLETIVARAQVDMNELSELLKEGKEEYKKDVEEVTKKLNVLLLRDARLGGIMWTAGALASAVTAAAGFLIDHFVKSP